MVVHLSSSHKPVSTLPLPQESVIYEVIAAVPYTRSSFYNLSGLRSFVGVAYGNFVDIDVKYFRGQEGGVYMWVQQLYLRAQHTANRDPI